MSAPARRIEVSVSSTAARSSRSGRGGRLDHRVLAADVVGGDRQARRLLDPADHVEVGQRRLDHDHVGALLDVEQRLAHGLVGVGGIHLVAAAVAERGRGVGGLAERPVERRGELRRVGDDRRVLVALRVELRAQRAHAAVHHVAGRHGVGAGRGVRDRRAGEQLERDVVVHLPVLAHDSAVAVRGVLAQAHVGDHDQVRVRLLERAHGQLHDALVVVCARALLVLLGGEPEQQHGRDAELMGDARLLDGVGDREPLDARHRLDGRAAVGAELHEHRVHEMGGAELGLADHVAQDAGLAQASHAGSGNAIPRSVRRVP